jgi:hypothetical protein
MKTKQMRSGSGKRNVSPDNSAHYDSEYYVTVGSSMNDETGNEKESDENKDQNFGYPDFFEDPDFCNRYIW